MLKINLLPDEAIERKDPLRLKAIVFFVVTILFAGISMIWCETNVSGKQNQLDKVNDQIQKIQSDIDQYTRESKDASTFSKQAMALKTLLKNHIRWSNLIDELQVHSKAGVVFTSFEGYSDGALNVQGEASSYSLVAQEMRSLEEATYKNGEEDVLLVDSIELSDASYGVIDGSSDGIVKFSMAIKINPSILYVFTDQN